MENLEKISHKDGKITIYAEGKSKTEELKNLLKTMAADLNEDECAKNLKLTEQEINNVHTIKITLNPQ